MATIKIKSGDQWTQIPMIGINRTIKSKKN